MARPFKADSKLSTFRLNIKEADFNLNLYRLSNDYIEWCKQFKNSFDISKNAPLRDQIYLFLRYGLHKLKDSKYFPLIQRYNIFHNKSLDVYYQIKDNKDVLSCGNPHSLAGGILYTAGYMLRERQITQFLLCNIMSCSSAAIAYNSRKMRKTLGVE